MKTDIVKEVPVKPYTKQELADLYEVSLKTLRTWFLPHEDIIGEKRGRCYTVKQVRTIFEVLGAPEL